MSSIVTAINISLPGVYYGKIAYDSVAIDQEFRKFLQFFSRPNTFQFVGLPNGLAEAPRKFTLLTKPILHFLSLHTIKFVGYLDDLLVIHDHEDPTTLKLHISLVCKLFL